MFLQTKYIRLRKALSVAMVISFVLTSLVNPQIAHAVTPNTVLNLPVPGTMVSLSNFYQPAIIKGVTFYPDNPLTFDFIIRPGQDRLQDEAFEQESQKLIKYFLAALTVPEDKLWVNLSPYEKNRIIADEFGQTEMGRDLLSQDYILKQLTASLMYPENELGSAFWTRVHREAQSRYGTTDVPMNTFNKIWIVPEKAAVYQNENSVFVVESKLKVMLEEDYLALEYHSGINDSHDDTNETAKNITTGMSAEVVKEILIPAIEREVNEGETFANLRQIYHSLILAAWYKKNLQKSFLGQIYVDQAKTKGIEIDDPAVNQKIYDQYIAAFKKGVYNYIKEDYDPQTRTTIPRHYFSGGVNYAQLSEQLEEHKRDPLISEFDRSQNVRVNLNGIDADGQVIQSLLDRAMASNKDSARRRIRAVIDDEELKFTEIMEQNVFDAPALDGLSQTGIVIAEAFGVKNINEIRKTRLAKAGGYEHGYLLIRERDPDNPEVIVEENNPGRLLRDKTLDPRIAKGVTFWDRGDWKVATPPELYAAAIEKLREEFGDIVKESGNVLAGDRDRLARLLVVITNYLDAVNLLRKISPTVGITPEKSRADQLSLEQGVKAVAQWLGRQTKNISRDQPVVIVLHGSPGSGKSTFKHMITEGLTRRGFTEQDRLGEKPAASQNVIHYYEELVESAKTQEGKWDNNFYGHKGVVIVESVLDDVPAEWKGKDNILFVHVLADDLVKDERLSNRDLASRAQQLGSVIAHYDYHPREKLDFRHSVSIQNNENLDDLGVLIQEQFLGNFDSGRTLDVQADDPDDMDHAMTARLGEIDELDFSKWGAKGAYFKLLKDIQSVLFSGRSEDIFPNGIMISTVHTREILDNEGITDARFEEVLADVEEATGKKLGDPENPLFLSVRSSPEFSMPDQLETILNIGMTENTIQTLIDRGADEATVLNAYRRFIGHFAHIVMGVKGKNESDLFDYELKVYLRVKDKSSEFDLAAHEQRELIGTYKRMIDEATDVDFPQDDVNAQLRMAIDVVTSAWDRDYVRDFRATEKIPDDSGYSVILQEMKFGNLNDRSGAGVVFTRDPHSGRKELTGDFVWSKQGTAIVSGKVKANSMDILRDEFPEIYSDLVNLGKTLEGMLGRVIDIEFTIEDGKLYILQIRPAELKIGAEKRVYEDFIKEGILNTVTKVQYLQRIQERIKRRHVMKVKDGIDAEVLFTAEVSSPGAVQGEAVFSMERFEELVAEGKPAILIIDYDDKANFHVVLKHSDKEVGIITNFGTSRSHIGIMTNKRLIPAVINRDLKIEEGELTIGDMTIHAGDTIVLDGNSARVIRTDESDVIEEDSEVSGLFIDDDVHENRKIFLETEGFLNQNSELLEKFQAADLLAMNWSKRAKEITRTEAGKLLTSEYTLGRLLDMNWRAWHKFLKAELAEAKHPDDELLSIEKDVKTQLKTFTHELLSLRGYAEGLTQKQTDTLHDEFIAGNKFHKYYSDVVYEETITAQEWEGIDSPVRANMESIVSTRMQEDPSLILDVRKTRSSSAEADYVVVLIQPATKEEPVDVGALLHSGGREDLLETPANATGTAATSMFSYDDQWRFAFRLGDHQVVNQHGDIVTLQDDYWSPQEMRQRVKAVEDFVEEQSPDKYRLKMATNELRGHQRKGNGYIGYSFWFTEDVSIDDETLIEHRQRPTIMSLATDGAREDRLDLVRKTLLALTDHVPGLHLDEVVYRYQYRWGQSKELMVRERHTFKIWKEYVSPEDIVSIQREVKQLFLDQPADIRNVSFLQKNLYTVSFPSRSFTLSEPQDFIDDMIQNNSDYLPDIRKQAAVDGLTLFIKELNRQGYNLSDDHRDEQVPKINIEILNNVSGNFANSDVRSLLRNLPFVFGMKDHDSVKQFEFYKRTIVISLEMLINIGIRGRINDIEQNQINNAVKETSFEPHTPRTVAQILSSEELVVDQDYDSAMKADLEWDDVKADGYDVSIQNLNTDKAPQSFKAVVTKNGKPLKDPLSGQESEVTFHIYPDLKLIVLETLYPRFPLPGSHDFVEGRGQAMFRNIFNSNDYAGYHMITPATRDARKAILKMPEYFIDANAPEVVALDETSDLIESNPDYIQFTYETVSSRKFIAMSESHRKYLQVRLDTATVHIQVSSSEVDRAIVTDPKQFTAEQWRVNDIVRSRDFATEWRVDAFLQYQSRYSFAEIPAISLKNGGRINTMSMDEVDNQYVFDRRIIKDLDELQEVYSKPELHGVPLDISKSIDIVDYEQMKIKRTLLMPNGKRWKGDNRLHFRTDRLSRVTQKIYFSSDGEVDVIEFEGYVTAGSETSSIGSEFWRWTGAQFRHITLNSELERLYADDDSASDRELDITKLLDAYYLAAAEIPSNFLLPDGTTFERRDISFKFGYRNLTRITMRVVHTPDRQVDHIVFTGYRIEGKKEVKVRSVQWKWKSGKLQYVEPVDNLRQIYQSDNQSDAQTVDISDILGYRKLQTAELPGFFLLPNGEILGEGEVLSLRMGIRNLSRIKMTIIKKDGQVAGLKFTGYRQGENGEDVAGYSFFDWDGQNLTFKRNSYEDKRKLIRDLYTQDAERTEAIDISDFLGLRNLQHGELNEGFPLPNGRTLGKLSPMGIGKDLEMVELTVHNNAGEYILEFTGYRSEQNGEKFEEVGRSLWREQDGEFVQTSDLITLTENIQKYLSEPAYHQQALDITLFFSQNQRRFGIFPRTFPFSNGNKWVKSQKSLRVGTDFSKIDLIPDFEDKDLKGMTLRAERLNAQGEEEIKESYWLADKDSFIFADGYKLIRSSYKTPEITDFRMTDITTNMPVSMLKAGQVPAGFPLPDGKTWGFLDYMRVGRDLSGVTLKVEFQDDQTTVKGITFIGYKRKGRTRVESGKAYWEWDGRRFIFKHKGSFVEKKIREAYGHAGPQYSRTINITKLFGAGGLKKGTIRSSFPLPNGKTWGGKNIQSMLIGENLSRIKIRVKYNKDYSVEGITFVGYRLKDGKHEFHRDSYWAWEGNRFVHKKSKAEKNKESTPDKIRALYASAERSGVEIDITDFVGTTGLIHGRLNRNFPLPNGKTLGKIQTLRLGSRKSDIASMLMRVIYDEMGIPSQAEFTAFPQKDDEDGEIIRTFWNLSEDGLEFIRIEKQSVENFRQSTVYDQAMTSSSQELVAPITADPVLNTYFSKSGKDIPNEWMFDLGAQANIFQDADNPRVFYKNGFNISILQEAEILARLNQASVDGIPQLQSIWVDQRGKVWMELQGIPRGFTFFSKEWGRFNSTEQMTSFIRIAEIIMQMHQAGWVHNDIKPRQFLSNVDKTVMLIDFATATRVNTEQEYGSEDFQSPELIKVFRSDVYSLGHSLYHAFRKQLGGISVGDWDKSGLKELYNRMTSQSVANRPDMPEVLAEFRRIRAYLSDYADPDYLGFEDVDLAITSEALREVDGTNKTGFNQAHVRQAPGGIDLNPNNFEIETQGEANEFQFDLTPVQLNDLNIEGFIPVIINVTPITNIPLLLGVAEPRSPEPPANTAEYQRQPAERKARFKQQTPDKISLLK